MDTSQYTTNTIPVEAFLRGCVGYSVTDEALMSIFVKRGVEPGTPAASLPVKTLELCKADRSDGTKEVNILVIAEGANTAGNITITLNNTPVTVALTATEDTPEEVATKIAGASFTGYTSEANGNMVVFTASEVGEKEPPVFEDTDNTGVVAVFGTPVKGTNAQEANLSEVNGLIFEDVYMPEGTIHATCAVVRAGRIYADRVAGGGLPVDIENQLPMIEFVREPEN